ncbi:TRAP transporter substrate-binding protein DctP [Parasalinivibrio latis]|uniref:TRAP transporter substrate-binding protein n=1 Tax=Parasalinivibrio latis TaxID=2952610 RepID=UPI0030E07026
MKWTKKHLKKLSSAAVLTAGLFSGGALAETWKFALEEIQGSVQDAYAQQFKKLVESKSGGDVTVEVYPYGTLGQSEDLTELTANGILQFTHASPGIFGSFVPEMQVFSIPYLLSQDNEVNKRVLGSSETIYKTLGGKLEPKNLKLLTMYPEGEMVWTTNREIRNPEDFDNFKMRVMASPMLVEAYKSFGADPTPLPYSEVYGALQLKMVDGQVNPIFAIEEMKFYEVTDYMIWAGQQQFTTTVITNNEWYRSLPEERQKLVSDVVSEMNDYIFAKQDEFNAARLEKIKKAKPEMKMVQLTEEERSVFKEASMSLREKYVDLAGDSGKQVLEALEAEFNQ